MALNGSHRRRVLTTGGILSIMGGLFEATGGAIMVALVIAHIEMFRQGGTTGHPGIYSDLFGFVDLIWLITVGVPTFALAIVAIMGGVSAIRRRIFGLSLAGAICTLPSVIFGLYLGAGSGALTSIILGILAVAFVALGKREFGAQK